VAPDVGEEAEPVAVETDVELPEVDVGAEVETASYNTVLAYVVQEELAGTATPWPGGAWESPRQDSKTPGRAFEGALKPHP
jgi:hypothetical protein